MSELKVAERHGRWRVYLDEQPVAAYSIGYYRPYIYPVLTPAGIPVTEESPVDHPHHQSIWFGQDKVNGHNLWLNRLGCGRIESKELPPRIIADRAVTFEERDHWLAPTGQILLTEQRTITIMPGNVRECPLLIDIESRRAASSGEARFGCTKEDGLGVRLHDALDGDDGGVIVNSHGERGEIGTFDQNAEWFDYSGRYGEHTVGIALFPHPVNPRCPWFTRDCGLIVFNPFRFHEVSLSPGGEIYERYRLVIHDGDHADADNVGLYRDYLRDIEG